MDSGRPNEVQQDVLQEGLRSWKDGLWWSEELPDGCTQTDIELLDKQEPVAWALGLPGVDQLTWHDSPAPSIWGPPTMDVEPDLHSFSAPPQVDSPVAVLGTPGLEPDVDDPHFRLGKAGRLTGKGFFLTFSQSSLTRDEIIKRLARERGVSRAIVGLEHHKDGNLHWHVLVEYERPKDVRSPLYFNIGREHPNVLLWTRSRGQTYDQWFYFHWKYCKKEDPTPYIIGEEPKENRKRKRDDMFYEAMQICKTDGVQMAMDFLAMNQPYEYATKMDQIFRTMTAIRNQHMNVSVPARAVSEFKHVPIVVDTWRVLYINGPSGTGKTQWARALLPEATVVRHCDQLRTVDFSKGVIFDDFDIGHWPPTAAIHLLDWEEPSGINVKHAHVMIPAHTRKIFTHNCSFDRWVSKDAVDEQVQAMKRRVHVLNITKSLF